MSRSAHAILEALKVVAKYFLINAGLLGGIFVIVTGGIFLQEGCGSSKTTDNLPDSTVLLESSDAEGIPVYMNRWHVAIVAKRNGLPDSTAASIIREYKDEMNRALMKEVFDVSSSVVEIHSDTEITQLIDIIGYKHGVTGGQAATVIFEYGSMER